MTTAPHRGRQAPHLPGTLGTVQDPEPPKVSARRVAERKLRHVRIETPLWVLACQKANSEGLTISAVVRRLLEAYVRDSNSYSP